MVRLHLGMDEFRQLPMVVLENVKHLAFVFEVPPFARRGCKANRRADRRKCREINQYPHEEIFEALFPLMDDLAI